MSEDQVRIGFDRYLKLEWANYALDLYSSREDPIRSYELLKSYIQHEVKGVETARKAANQLKRMWLHPRDEYHFLREAAAKQIHINGSADYSIFHFGIAINVFPIFRITCQKIGEVAAIQGEIPRNTIIERVSRNYLNPSSTPRVVMRIFQTLEGWGFITGSRNVIRLRELPIHSDTTAEWFIQAMMLAIRKNVIPKNQFYSVPEKLGIKLPDVRSLIQSSGNLLVRRGNNGEELISFNP